MNKYTEFLEKYLGTIQYGWSKNENDQKLPFKIVKYAGGPFPGTVSYSTLGLSNENLTSIVSGKQIRQELIFNAYASFGDNNIPGILQQIGQLALKNKRAYLRGDVIGPNGKIFDNSDLEALYITSPVYFTDEFFTFDIDNKTAIIQAWVIPITSQEADFIKKYGWDKFEDMLVDINPDLIDFNRLSIV
ncbi:hypothetical protein GC102_10745 [Paenibacillus sp. LMG 31460]|uniref:Suppressor of fused-like domain-containing protein n=1 Tax=Paenibacillus germinis TaxID=2654979 RepID=A0ABX1Z098_9BACL|nr:suppressor of fused domain protein [Paenibacillus germinis]NOU86249.1 hypothetical protein [Paenibacillus germinis]